MELGEPDSSGRRRPVEIAGSNYVIPVDEVIMSIGTRPNPLLTREYAALQTTKRGTLIKNNFCQIFIPFLSLKNYIFIILFIRTLFNIIQKSKIISFKFYYSFICLLFALAIIVFAAFLPAPIASITVAAPVTARRICSFANNQKRHFDNQ